MISSLTSGMRWWVILIRMPRKLCNVISLRCNCSFVHILSVPKCFMKLTLKYTWMKMYSNDAISKWGHMFTPPFFFFKERVVNQYEYTNRLLFFAWFTRVCTILDLLSSFCHNPHCSISTSVSGKLINVIGVFKQHWAQVRLHHKNEG